MLESVLKKIKPSFKEETNLKKKVNEFLSKLKLNDCEYLLGGSYAKNTWLKGQHDIDIFIRFKDDENISNKLEGLIRKSFKKYERIHGSRDYFLIKFKGINFELIPVLKINSYKEAKNTTDVSSLHVLWVKQYLNKQQCDEVRLAKQFCKVNRVYGAETYIKGFHGYLLEILISHYGSFLSFLGNASRLKQGLTIDTSNHSTFNSQQKFPLIVIDPVQPNRNVASALSFEKFNSFIKASREFLKKKDLLYFKIEKFNLKGFNLILKAKPLKGSNDVIGTKLLKAYALVNYELRKNNFNVLSSDWHWNKHAYFCFKIENKKLSKFEKYLGPPINKEYFVKAFKNKYKNLQFGIENNRIYVVRQRAFNEVKKLIKYLMKNKDLRRKVKKLEIVKV